MLITLWTHGYVDLDPAPPDVERNSRLVSSVAAAPRSPTASREEFGGGILNDDPASGGRLSADNDEPPATTNSSDEPVQGTFGALLQEALATGKSTSAAKPQAKPVAHGESVATGDEREDYLPRTATPTPDLSKLLLFRSVNPLYGMYLVEQLGAADEAERIQALESVLEIPGSVFLDVRAPGPDELPPGPLASGWLDPLLIERGLATAEEIDPTLQDEDAYGRRRSRGLLLGDKLRRLFDSEYGSISPLRTSPVWVAGQLLEFGGDFQKLVTSRDLTKQEGILFRHLLRFILLCGEFSELCPPSFDPVDWRNWLRETAEVITAACRVIDPESTDKSIESMSQADPLTSDQ
jgi:hypothetical protein